VNYIFRGVTKSQSNFMYCSKAKEFVKLYGPNMDFQFMPSFIQLSPLFWVYIVLRKIVVETNWYTTTSNEDEIAPGRRI